MALEAVVFSEGFCGRRHAMASEGGGAWSWGGGHGHSGVEGVVELDGSGAYWGAGASSSVMVQGLQEEPDGGSSVAAAPPPVVNGGGRRSAVDGGAVAGHEGAAAAPAPAARRRKRRRARSVKNREEVESQRMTHIAVERNRRKQMNEYLAVLRSLMPVSYVQRGDQASIIGGAINYVKELEQLLQSLEAQRHARQECHLAAGDASTAAVPFAGFFTFPQYSMASADAGRSPPTENTAPSAGDGSDDDIDGGGNTDAGAGDSCSKQSAVADVEVTMVESHANLRLLSRRRPRQLLRMVAGLQAHRLAVLHLNVTSAGHMALYSLSLKVEDDCQLSSVDDIATAVHRIVETIEQEEQQSCIYL